MQPGSPEATIIKQTSRFDLYNDGTYTINTKYRKTYSF